MFPYEDIMKKILAVFLAGLVISGCTVVVNEQPYYQPPSPQFCRWVEIPVYGYADLYRNNGTVVRVQQVSFIDRQWRCN